MATLCMGADAKANISKLFMHAHSKTIQNSVYAHQHGQGLKIVFDKVTYYGNSK